MYGFQIFHINLLWFKSPKYNVLLLNKNLIIKNLLIIKDFFEAHMYNILK